MPSTMTRDAAICHRSRRRRQLEHELRTLARVGYERQIAAVFRLTESRICQIHAQTILGLRGFLDRVRNR